MKIKLKRAEVYALEDVLLDLYYGLPVEDHTGSEQLSEILTRIQNHIWKEDILDA